jgi:hypothetical protein
LAFVGTGHMLNVESKNLNLVRPRFPQSTAKNSPVSLPASAIGAVSTDYVVRVLILFFEIKVSFPG